ncbi:hypothetical protein ABPG75_006998 [Micractinium tetrahymenae]
MPRSRLKHPAFGTLSLPRCTRGGGTGGCPATALFIPRSPAKHTSHLSHHAQPQEAVERAYAKDRAGQRGDAARLYRTSLDIILEGLALPLPSAAGLDASHSNTARWRSDMNQWQQRVLERLRDLEGGGGAAGGLGGGAAAAAAAARGSPPNPLRRQLSGAAAAAAAQQQQQRGASPRSAAAPRARAGTAAAAARHAAGPLARAGGSGGGSRDEQEFEERVMSEVLDRSPAVAWDDVAGLATAKQALQEMVILPSLRADLFQGLRAPARGLLLYGPPGNGKTLLAKALAHEARAMFFNISAASLTSRWHGDAEKLVRALFRAAAHNQPSIIFIDEIDSILSERSSSEHEASRRLKTEFLVQFDGVAGSSDRVVVIGATNRPWELDDAVRRRLPKRVCVPLPDAAARLAIVQRLLTGQRHELSASDLKRVVACTEGYSGSDLAALCKEAAMLPIRELGPAIRDTPADRVRPIRLHDFEAAIRAIKPSVSRDQLRRFEEWTREYGMSS